MQAWQFEAFGGPEKLARHEVERPAPGPGEALVRVTYCGVNPIDRSVGAGRFPWIALPHTPGAEIVGVLEAVGPGPANEAPPLGTPVALAFRIFCGRCYYCLRGHEEACIADPRGANAPVAIGVTAPGGWAEYVLAPAKNCLPLPPGLAAEIACTAVVDGTTAWHLLDRARVAPDERVLVVGATGGVGLYALQIARQRGALVAAIAGGAEKAAALREFGPDLLLDRTRDDVVARVDRRPRRGRGHRPRRGGHLGREPGHAGAARPLRDLWRAHRRRGEAEPRAALRAGAGDRGLDGRHARRLAAGARGLGGRAPARRDLAHLPLR